MLPKLLTSLLVGATLHAAPTEAFKSSQPLTVMDIKEHFSSTKSIWNLTKQVTVFSQLKEKQPWTLLHRLWMMTLCNMIKSTYWSGLRAIPHQRNVSTTLICFSYQVVLYESAFINTDWNVLAHWQYGKNCYTGLFTQCDSIVSKMNIGSCKVDKLVPKLPNYLPNSLTKARVASRQATIECPMTNKTTRERTYQQRRLQCD